MGKVLPGDCRSASVLVDTRFGVSDDVVRNWISSIARRQELIVGTHFNYPLRTELESRLMMTHPDMVIVHSIEELAMRAVGHFSRTKKE